VEQRQRGSSRDRAIGAEHSTAPMCCSEGKEGRAGGGQVVVADSTVTVSNRQ